jgi:hypothetical protein
MRNVAIDVMIFAVHIIGNGTSEGHKFCTRCHRKKKSKGHCKRQNLFKGHASFGTEDSIGTIKLDKMIKASCQK